MGTRDGGKPVVKDVRNYRTPQGPSGQMNKGPGLHGDNHDCGEYGSNEHMSGGPGIGGTNHSNKGTQGHH